MAEPQGRQYFNISADAAALAGVAGSPRIEARVDVDK